jgi:hypothetical protein
MKPGEEDVARNGIVTSRLEYSSVDVKACYSAKKRGVESIAKELPSESVVARRHRDHQAA